MEPAEGPGALGFHGDEEIIEVVELGPPGPGETGRPRAAHRAGPAGLRPPAGAPGPLRPRPSAGPGMAAGPVPFPDPGSAASPRVALRSLAAPLLRVSRPRSHRDRASPPPPPPPSPRLARSRPPWEGRAGQAASAS